MIPIRIPSILLLVGAVTKFGHPLRAAVVLGAITAGLEFLGGTPVQTALLQAGRVTVHDSGEGFLSYLDDLADPDNAE